MDENAFKRFMQHIRADEITGCWVWQANKDKDGYGRFMDGGRTWQAHKFAYTRMRGEVPNGLVLDHKCRNRSCCNPDHLEAITNRENILRGNGMGARNARKTECKRGHPFDERNTRHYRNQRICRRCDAMHRREYHRRKKMGVTLCKPKTSGRSY